MNARFVAAIFVISSCSIAGAYSGGSGTQADPYQIASPADWLELVATTSDWSAHFVLTADLDLADSADLGTVGQPYEPFTGSFDGQGRTIASPTIDLPERSQVGLFGSIEDAALSNVNVTDASITGYDQVAILAGKSVRGALTNCTVSGTVTGRIDVGGLAGNCQEGAITACFSTAPVTAESYIGGLVGTATTAIRHSAATGDINCASTAGGFVGRSGGSISRCWATGDVLAARGSVAALVGINYGVISDCYAAGNTTVESATHDKAAGLVAWNYDHSSRIENCYSTGSVQGGRYYIGALVGKNDGAVLSCFWDTDTSNRANSAAGTGLPTTQMLQQQTFANAGWDLIHTWNIADHQTYPLLRTTLAADLNKDGAVNLHDLAILTAQWCMTWPHN